MSQSTANDQFNPRLYGESMLIEKALADSAFKQALLSNPKATVAAEFGIELPDDLMVQVVEAQPDHFYLRLPAKPEIADTVSLEELTQLLSNSEDEVLAVLVAKAWKEDEFKQLLLNDPKAALVQQFGTELPATLTIEVLEETDDTVIVLLPPPADEAQELSNEQLEAIAGGNSSSQIQESILVTSNKAQNSGGNTGSFTPLSSSLTTTTSGNQTIVPTLTTANKDPNVIYYYGSTPITLLSPAEQDQLTSGADKSREITIIKVNKTPVVGNKVSTTNTTKTNNVNPVSNSYAPKIPTISSSSPPW